MQDPAGTRLRLRPTDRVLDVGCGTGALLERLSKVHPASLLSGVDPVPEMLAVARRRVPAEVELREGWAERLPFAEEQSTSWSPAICSITSSGRWTPCARCGGS
jgi:ubiquinone/menaquinone biosynthesis C-methylase UbiE